MELDAIDTSGTGSARAEKVSGNDKVWLRQWAVHPERACALAMVEQRTAACIAKTGRGLELSDADLSGLNLSGFDLRHATLNRARLHSTDLSDANLTEASMVCPGMEKTVFRGANLEGAYVHALAAQVCDFSEANLDALVDATGSLFHGCTFTGATLRRAVLSGSTFYQCTLDKTNFQAAALQGSTFNESYLESARFEHAGLDQVTFTKCWLGSVSFRAASGEGVVIQRPTYADFCCLTGASLRRLRLEDVRATELDATEVKAAGADIANCVFERARFACSDWSQSRWLDSSMQQADFTNAKMTEAQIVRCNFVNAVLSDVQAETLHVVESGMQGANLRGFSGRASVFRDCDLSGVDLERAYLYRAMLTGDPPRSMSLRRANLHAANIVQAYIAADLEGAELSHVVGAYARLNQSFLRDANLQGAGFFGASFIKTDFRGAKVTNITGPFFADRCPGLMEAAERADDAKLADFLEVLEGVMRTQRRTST